MFRRPLFIDPNSIFVWVNECPPGMGRDNSECIRSLEASDVCEFGEFERWHHEPGISDLEMQHWFLERLSEASKRAPWFLRIEDDTIVHPDLLRCIAEWPAVMEPGFGVGTVHQIQFQAVKAGHWCLQQSPLTGSLLTTEKFVAGANAFLYRSDQVQKIIDNWCHPDDKVELYSLTGARTYRPDCCWFDFYVSAACKRAGLEFYVHTPSLTKLGEAAFSSALSGTQNAPFEQTWRFDPSWRRDFWGDVDASRLLAQ